MAPLMLRVLGPPRLERDGDPIALNLRRAVALLVYLAVTGRPQGREALAALLWPDGDEREARARLRRTLHRLAEVLGEDVVASDGDSLCLSPDAGVWVDSLVFEQEATAGLAAHQGFEGGDAAGVAHLEQAAQVYGGDFLAGFGLPDNPSWEEWQFYQREGLRQRLAGVLERLVAALQAQATSEAAIPFARRWVALDPLHEPAQRALMRLYALAGQQAAAVRQYQECARLLDAELGVPPEDETTALYEAIRTRRLVPRMASQPDGPLPSPAAESPQQRAAAATAPAPDAPRPGSSAQDAGREQDGPARRADGLPVLADPLSRPTWPDTAPGLRMQLLGTWRVGVGSRVIEPAAWPLRKAQSLVKLLALAPGHRLHREQLIATLWPDADPRAGANNLYKALHLARRVLTPDLSPAPGYLQRQGDLLLLSRDEPAWIDVEAFEAAAAAAAQTAEPSAYWAAVELYAGDLLPEDRYED
jgi:DNA-binding SARP family transcriptional activator